MIISFIGVMTGRVLIDQTSTARYCISDGSSEHLAHTWRKPGQI